MFLDDIFEEDDKKRSTRDINSLVSNVYRKAEKEFPGVPPEQAIVGHIGNIDRTNAEQDKREAELTQQVLGLSQDAQAMAQDIQDKEQRFRDQEARFRAFNKKVAAMGANPVQAAQAADRAAQDIEVGREPQVPQQGAAAPAATTAEPADARGRPGTKAKTKSKPAADQEPGADSFDKMAKDLSRGQTRPEPAPGADSFDKMAKDLSRGQTRPEPATNAEPELDNVFQFPGKGAAADLPTDAHGPEADVLQFNRKIAENFGLDAEALMDIAEVNTKNLSVAFLKNQDCKVSFPTGPDVTVTAKQIYDLVQILKQMPTAGKDALLINLFSNRAFFFEWMFENVVHPKDTPATGKDPEVDPRQGSLLEGDVVSLVDINRARQTAQAIVNGAFGGASKQSLDQLKERLHQLGWRIRQEPNGSYAVVNHALNMKFALETPGKQMESGDQWHGTGDAWYNEEDEFTDEAEAMLRESRQHLKSRPVPIARENYWQRLQEERAMNQHSRALSMLADALEPVLFETKKGEADYGAEYQATAQRAAERAKALKNGTKTIWVPNEHGTGGRYKVVPAGQDKKDKGVAEGSEFGAKYAEQVAQQIFNKRQDISSEDEILNQAYHIVSDEQGQRSARYMFNYDADFPSDLVSAYSWLQKSQGVAEARAISKPEDGVAAVKKFTAYVKRNILDLASTADFESKHSKQPYVDERFKGFLTRADGTPVTPIFNLGGELKLVGPNKEYLNIPIEMYYRLQELMYGGVFEQDILKQLGYQQGVAEGFVDTIKSAFKPKMKLEIEEGEDELYVDVTLGGKKIAVFTFDHIGDDLMAQDMSVRPEYRGKGIAKWVYDSLKNKGYNVQRSPHQTDAGAHFWDKNKGVGSKVWEQGMAEVSDKTLTSYLTKVDADSRKHKSDPTKRSPEKANRSVQGFSRAFNKLDSRKATDLAKRVGEGEEQSMRYQEYMDKAEKIHELMMLASKNRNQAEFEKLKKQRDELDSMARKGLISEENKYALHVIYVDGVLVEKFTDFAKAYQTYSILRNKLPQYKVKMLSYTADQAKNITEHNHKAFNRLDARKSKK